jgi:hypothetical protein
MRLERKGCERRGGVDSPFEDALKASDSGDQVSREFLMSWLFGIAILRVISNVVRHRICRRAPERHAICDAVGDGTECEDATADQYRYIGI